MARRAAWAKVYCDLLRHPKVIGRPDSDVRLFLGLILYAKEYAPDTGLVALSPEDMRSTFGIKAPLKAVLDGIAYFVKESVLVREGDFVRLRDFAARQKDDSSAARTRAWRERHGDDLKASLPASPKVTNGVTFNRLAPSRVTREVEGEVEEENVDSSKGGESERRDIHNVGNSLGNQTAPEEKTHIGEAVNSALEAIRRGEQGEKIP